MIPDRPTTEIPLPEVAEHIVLQILDLQVEGPLECEGLSSAACVEDAVELADPVEFRHGYLVLSVVLN